MIAGKKRPKGQQPPVIEVNPDIILPSTHGRPVGAVIPTNQQPDNMGIVENEARITNRPARHSTVDSQYVPLSSIMVYADGTRWPCDWYSAQVGLDDELVPLAPGTAPAHQQYTVYRDFFINVDSAITPSQDDDTKEFDVTGNATVFFQVRPNKHDMFVADVGDGRAGIFVVTSTKRISYTQDAAYNIEYKLVRYYTVNDDIEEKVIKTFYFDLRLAEINRIPFLTEEDYVKSIKLDELQDTLRTHFIRMFWSRTCNMIKLPLQFIDTHDAYHADFCLRMGLGDSRNAIQVFKNGFTKISDTYSIWDLINSLSIDQLPYTHTEYGIVPTHTFCGYTLSRGVYWTPFKATVYPKGEFDTADKETIKRAVMFDIIDKVTKPTTGICEICGADTGTPDIPVPPNTNIFPEYPLTTYVFSEHFYKNERDMCSKIERLTLDVLNELQVNRADIYDVARAVRKADLLTQYYCIPIILFIIDYSFVGSL